MIPTIWLPDLAVIAVGLSWAALMAVAVPDFVQQIMRRENARD